MSDIGKESPMYIRKWMDYEEFIKDTSPTQVNDGYIVHKKAVYDTDAKGNRFLKEPASDRIYLSMCGEPVNECTLVGVLSELNVGNTPLGGFKAPHFVEEDIACKKMKKLLESAVDQNRCLKTEYDKLAGLRITLDFDEIIDTIEPVIGEILAKAAEGIKPTQSMEYASHATRALENALERLRCKDCKKCARPPASGHGGSIWCVNTFLREAQNELKGEEE